MNSFPIANHILWRANQERADISPLKLQKIMYFLHGWYLAITGQELIDEKFMKWQYGPVLPSVYRAFRGFGSLPINDYINEYEPASGTWLPLFVNPAAVPHFQQVFDRVWSEYSGFSALQLSSMTHEDQAPWSNTATNDEISNDLIRNYFVAQANHRFANSLAQ